MPTPTNSLYYGDNLDILRKHIPDESIDLVYLDPPFNSKRNYNVLFNNPKGHQSQAQITAFEDTWHWGEQAEREYNEVLQQPNTDVAEMIFKISYQGAIHIKHNCSITYFCFLPSHLTNCQHVRMLAITLALIE